MLPYYKIEFSSKITDKLVDIIKSPDPIWIDYFNFQMLEVPTDLTDQDPFLHWLRTVHDFRSAILKMDPYECYNWHEDNNRGVCINMLLTPDIHCYTLFSAEIKNPATFKFCDLKYTANDYYLFNNQITHTVINFDKTRYLFSIEFAEDKTKLNYNFLLEEIISHRSL